MFTRRANEDKQKDHPWLSDIRYYAGSIKDARLITHLAYVTLREDCGGCNECRKMWLLHVEYRDIKRNQHDRTIQ